MEKGEAGAGMKSIHLPLKNLTRKPGRTVALVVLTAFLAFSVFGGSVVLTSLQRGLNSMEGRLGADIIVVPAEAESKVSLKNLFLQGAIGAFYMDAGAVDRVMEVEGVAQAAPQIFLASLRADCCSVRIQIIGFDPANDFVVQPWIEESYTRALETMDVVVGCRVETEVGRILRIYDQDCRVVARLAETGTGLDTAVYCNLETIQRLLAAAEEKGISHKIDSGGEDVVSAIYVKVSPGADVAQVNTRLNGHIRKATAVRTRSMITEVADSLSGVSNTVTLLIVAVWVLALVILLIAYAMMIHERRREFAVLRLLGLSRAKLAGEVLAESALCGLLGGVAGVLLACALIFPFTTLIESSLGLPYLMPEAGWMMLLGVLMALICGAVSALASGWSALRLSRTDPGTTLREGA